MIVDASFQALVLSTHDAAGAKPANERRFMALTDKMQATIERPFEISGAGLLSGKMSRVIVSPALMDHGLVFQVRGETRTDTVAATWENRVPSAMSTALGLSGGQKLRMVEHMLAAFSAFGVDNALIHVQGNEIPILDGSAARWCAALQAAGVVAQSRPRRVIKICQPIQVARDGGFIRGEPGEGLHADVTFGNLPGFGPMRWAGQINRGTFVAEIGRARSFGRPSWAWLDRAFAGDARVLNGPGSNKPDPQLPEPSAIWEKLELEKMRSTPNEPILRGARPWRAAVVIGPWILGGRRFPDEPVRHVVLDMIGDLSLAGGAIEGRIIAHVPSHEKTFAFVAALMNHPTAAVGVDSAAQLQIAASSEGPGRQTAPDAGR
jgi:UDP-3-O-[3-hydroxymyristoyl] N-acetylglucosamine deacetylase